MQPKTNRKAYMAAYYLTNKPTHEQRYFLMLANRDKRKIYNQAYRDKIKANQMSI
jgi:hypothetical protein